MKKRILFVDDEGMVLQGLQRSMRVMRNEWDIEFVDSGPKALAYMKATTVDVVVSDMRMPGMNGAQLLGEVMKLFPKTVRLILSGHADHELILQCVGSTHQFLSKPCDPEELRATVRRAVELEQSLNNDHIQQLVGRMECLPSVPALYSEIVDKMHDPETTLDEVGKIIGRDMGMSAQILKLVNSAFFGLRREVSNPTEAVAYLGLDTIKSLVLSLHAFSQFDSARAGGFSISSLWEHSMQTASLARRLTQIHVNDRKLMDEAFASGLLHDAGKAALAFNFPEDYAKILKQGGGCNRNHLRFEKQTFGATHADVGGYLLGLWGLPTPVVEAIALHHQPLRSECKVFSPLTAVHVADAIIHSNGDPDIGVDADYLKRLNLTDRLDDWRHELSNQATAAM